MMSSPNEIEQESCTALSVQSSENEKESVKKVRSRDEMTAANQSGSRDIEEDEDEEFTTSLSVGDGHYLVDLGSSSEFVVDEECLLQLLKTCRECHKQCFVRKRVKGLKMVVSRVCCFCESRTKWSNLLDDDDGDFQINGKDKTHGRSNSAKK